jgi:shikimate kinase
MKRVKRRATADRPMLQGDPAQRVRHLMAERYPFYAEADATVMSREVSHEVIVSEIITELARVLGIAAPVPVGAAP